MYFLKNLLFSGAWIRQTKCVVIITKEGSSNIINFMTPRSGVFVLGCGHTSHIVKCIISLKFLFSTPIYFIRQTKYRVIMTKERSTKIVNIMIYHCCVQKVNQFQYQFLGIDFFKKYTGIVYLRDETLHIGKQIFPLSSNPKHVRLAPEKKTLSVTKNIPPEKEF